MTPVQGWSEHDYYRASRAARRAYEARSEQLQIAGVLDSEAVKRAEARRSPAAAASVSSPPFAAVAESPRGGLDVPAEEDAVGAAPVTRPTPAGLRESPASAGLPEDGA